MYTGMMSLVNEPGFDLANGFIAAFKNTEDPNHMYAVKIYKDVVDTYYDGVQITELEADSLLLNVQQHVGIILNLFNSEIGRLDEYDEKNLIEFGEQPVDEKPAEGEKPDGDGESKNA